MHFAIPTPVLVPTGPDRLRPLSVLLRYKTRGSEIQAIHVYDGERRIGTQDGLELSAADWALHRVNTPNAAEIRWGVGISILVNFGPDDRWIEFSAAGCDFAS